MKIKLQVQQYNHAPEFSYHCIDDSRLVINGKLFVLSDGAAWLNAMKDSDGLIMSVTRDAEGTVWELLCQYVSSCPSAEECALHAVAPEVIGTIGMSVYTLSAQTQEEIDSAANATEVADLKVQLAALDTVVSRSAENMFKQGIYTSISDREKTAIAQKEVLRAQIATLS